MRLMNVLLALGAVAGAVVFVLFYDSAFPAAAIDLDLSRSEIRARADDYVRERGIDPDTFKSALTFEVDGEAAVFLQRVLGLQETSRIAREQLALWNWRVRWFRSGEKEEFILRLTPDGRPLRFHHAIPEAAAGDSLSQDSALAIAAAFVGERLDIDLAGWRLEDQSTQTRDNRLDHSFTWEKIGSEIEWRPDDPEAGTGSTRLAVGIYGSEIGSFSQYIDVPEMFSREQSKETSVGSLLSLVSFGLSFAFIIIALVLAIVLYKRDQIRWRPGLVLGVVLGVSVVLVGLLSYPVIKSLYVTEIGYPVFAAMGLAAAIMVGVVLGLATWVTAAAGQSLASESFSESLRVFGEWVSGRFFSRAAAIETLRGYAIALAFLGYVTVFYLVGVRYLGVWLPADSPHSQLLSMYLPWLVPLLIATQASVSEEVMYRLFGVSVLKRYLKYTFPALLIPAMIWAFAHSTYPVYPVYVRGIELTIVGLVFGWVFIKYGLVAMFVAHYAIDAILLAMPFLKTAGGEYVGYGVAAMFFAALPLVVPLIAWRRPPDSDDRLAARSVAHR